MILRRVVVLKINQNIHDLFIDLNGNCKLVTFVNPFSYFILKDSKDSIYLNMDYIFADGILLVKLNNLLEPNRKIKRYSFDFTSLAPIVFKYSSDNNLRVALVGGTHNEINLACSVLKKKYPVLDIVYQRDGFFDDELDQMSAIDIIKSLDVDILICGMGTPLQEMFILKASQSVPSLKYCFTCGGFLSQIASKEEYFNPVLNKLNLRWLQRAYRHSYVRKRLLFDYPRFIVKFINLKLNNNE